MRESLKKTFNHIKVHTQFSICEGAVKINELQDFCKKNKIPSVAVSDTQNLSGALEFSELISSVGTQPIIGTQLLFKFKNYFGLIPLIAKNIEGYKNIIELSSKSYLESNSLSEPHCLLDDLFKRNNGIIVLSGSIKCLIGNLFNKGLFEDIDTILKSLSENFKDNFYIEIQRHDDLNEKEFETVRKSLDCYLLANMTEFGKTKLLVRDIIKLLG